MEPTLEQMQQVGWNTPTDDNPVLFQRIVSEQLSLIGQVLVQIRDALIATTSPGKDATR